MKYISGLYIKANSDQVEYIGEIKADTLKQLKENARKHAIAWNKHLYGRLHLEVLKENDKTFEMCVNTFARR